ncbi:N-formylglutamate amidohydrolase [Patescibacteria group bacterium]|nr:N-formylglutamate amidohydrolase [Patescibacteria group bacterium]MBU1683068.1 N-formylglutamate amidohydrolase [Patescibacteria group bacterium]
MASEKYPILITIPHCSTFVPADLRRMMELTDAQIRRQCDPFTDVIFDVPKVHVVKAKISRLVTDLNRAPDDIEMEYKLSNDGVVVSVDLDGNQIYKTPPSIKTIFDRVKRYHDTFHEKIEEIKPNIKFLIDGHSLRSVSPPTRSDAGTERADIVLGNRDFTTCTRNMTKKVMRFFQDRGYSVAINDPYKGRYLIGYHCSRRHLPGIQIEINERLYINEKTHRPHQDKMYDLRTIMAKLVDEIDEEIEKIGVPAGSRGQERLF